MELQTQYYYIYSSAVYAVFFDTTNQEDQKMTDSTYKSTAPHMYRDQAGWTHAYKQKKALWIHNNNPKNPHVELTSGNHSNGFFNSRLVVPDDILLHHAASDLIEAFVKQGGDISNIQGVVGPQTGATKLAKFLACKVVESPRDSCFHASPKKDDTAGVKSMIFDDVDQANLPNQLVLLCEDVLTTGGSVRLTVDALHGAGAAVMDYVLVLVNRSGLKEVDGRKIVALIEHHMPIWTPRDCPLCKLGSKAVRAKDNWGVLNAQY